MQQSSSLIVSSLIIVIYHLAFTKRKAIKLTNREKFLIILSGILGTGLSGLIGLLGLQMSTSINYGFLIKTSVVFTVIFSLPVLKEPINRNKVSYLAVLLLGTYLLSTAGTSLVPHSGDTLILLAAGCIGASAVLLRRVAKRNIDPEFITFIRILSGAIVIVSIAFFVQGRIFELEFLPYIAMLSVLQVLIIAMWARTLSVASASYGTMMSMSTPLIVVLLAYPLFGEKMNITQLIGGGLIIFGGVMTQIKGFANHD